MKTSNPLALPLPILSPAAQREPCYASRVLYFLMLACVCLNEMSRLLFSFTHSCILEISADCAPAFFLKTYIKKCF